MKAIEVEAEIIPEEALVPLGEVDKWLGNTAMNVADIAKQYGTIEVNDAASYKACKRARAQLRKEIASIEQQRKDMTRVVEQAISNFKSNAQDVLEPLNRIDAEYKAAIDVFESAQLADRKAELAQEYKVMAPALVPLVPFELIWNTFAKEKGWELKGTSQEKCYQDLCRIVERIAEDENTINNLDMTDAERQDCRDEFFKTLNSNTAIKEIIAKRERMKALESLDTMRAEQQEPKPVKEPETAPQSTTGATKRVLEIEATQEQFMALISWLKSNNIHGTLRGANNV